MIPIRSAARMVVVGHRRALIRAGRRSIAARRSGPVSTLRYLDGLAQAALRYVACSEARAKRKVATGKHRWVVFSASYFTPRLLLGKLMDIIWGQKAGEDV
jgi:hypothetical protein